MQSTSTATSPPPRARARTGRGNYAVILASGAEDGGKRAALALSAACTAQALDLDTVVFLAGDGVYWGYEGRVEAVHVPGFPPLADLMESFFESGGQVFLCSACDAVCALPTGADGNTLRRRRGVRLQGLASILSHTLEGGSLTF